MDQAFQKRVLGVASVAAKQFGKDGKLDGIVTDIKVGERWPLHLLSTNFFFSRRGNAKAVSPQWYRLVITSPFRASPTFLGQNCSE